MTDITDATLLQAKLAHSEKMATIGRLVSGVAHEVNNPLAAILGFTDLLLENPDVPASAREDLQIILQETQRTKDIVQDLLSFARQRPVQRELVSVNHVLRQTIKLRSYDFASHGVEVREEFDEALNPALGDAQQLQQVFLNILNNAYDAVQEAGQRGRIVIRTSHRNNAIEISITDNGTGINDPERIFDPFYTTKHAGKGTGLGLSICYGIVKEHSGEISAQNHPAGGALLQVRLPVAIGEKPVTERERIVARRESRLEGNVLLVDDEEAVLDFEREVLSSAGLQVVTVSAGAEAVESLKNEDFDILLLDSKLPGTWSSEQVFQWLQENRPELVPRTVFVLSDVSDPGMRAFVDATKIFCLVKPFEVSDLLAVVRRALRRVRAASASH
jgi:two-component system NtrC family sensor kinase